MKMVGYLTKYPDGLSGERGQYYTYTLASNGLFIETESPIISVRIPIAECDVRGLAPLEMKVTLTYGSIPQRFWDLALDTFLAEPDKESYVAITADAGYHFYSPVQDKNGGSVTYEVGQKVVLDLHSHGKGGSFFSTTDNKDEAGLKLYGVVGKLNTTPVVKLRVGVYGYFYPLFWKDIFDGSLAGAVEYEGEEVITERDVCGYPESYGLELEHPGRRVWWNRWLRRRRSL